MNSCLTGTSRLERLSELLLELTDHLSASYLPPATIRILFQLVCRESPLQKMFLTAVATILSAGCGRREFPAVVAVPLPATAARFRAVSASSSDSGLCSVHSSGQAPSPLPPPAGHSQRSLCFLNRFLICTLVIIRYRYPVVLREKPK